MTAVADRFAVLTGGFNRQTFDTEDKVLIFDSQPDKWLTDPPLPKLTTARASHGSCSLGLTVYVFGGSDIND